MVDVSIQGEWSYGGDPSESPRDAVRYKIGDTDETDPMLSDEEVDYELSDGTDVQTAAMACVRRLIARFARMATSKSVERLSVDYGKRVENLKALLEELKIEGIETTLVPSVHSPTTKAQKVSETRADGAQDEPYFRTGRDDFTRGLDLPDRTIGQF